MSETDQTHVWPLKVSITFLTPQWFTMLKFYYTVTANWNNIRTYATWSTIIWRDLAEFAVKNYDERKKQETKLDLDERYTLNARKWRKREWINCCIHAKRGRVFESITKIGVSRFLIWLGWFRQSLSAWMFNLIRHRFCISNHGKDWLQWLRARGGHSIFFLLVCSFISYMESES